MANTSKDNEDLDAYVAEPLSDERLRRMKRLLREMYQEEFATRKLHLPPIKTRSLILVLSLVSILVFGITTLYNFNRFVTLEERVLSAEGHVQDVLQRRRNLFHNLVNMTLNNAVLEQEIVQQVTDRRTEIGRRAAAADATSGGVNAAPATTTNPAAAAPVPGAPAVTRELLAQLADNDLGREAVAKLLAVAEQYPHVTTTVTYQQLMDKLVEMEDRISHRRDEYNEEVRVYNTLITSFPWYFLARITGFRRAEYYHVTHTESPQMSPEEFQRLLPLANKRRAATAADDGKKSTETGSIPKP